MKELEAVYKYLKSLVPSLEPADLAPLEGAYRRESFRAGETVFREGDRYRKVTFVLRGLLKKSYVTAEGKEFIKEFAWDGQVTTPYASLLRDGPASYSMEALEDVELLTVDWARVDSLLRSNSRWLAIGKALADFHFLNREDRELELLKHDAETRYAIFRKKFPELLGRLKKKDIAAYLGITAVSLSRIEGR